MRNTAGRGSDGGTVVVWLVVELELGLNNCHTRASLSFEPGNTRTMLSPLKFGEWGWMVEGGVGIWLR